MGDGGRPDAERFGADRSGVPGLSAGRRRAGVVLAVLGLPLVTLVLHRLDGGLSLPSDILVFLALVVAVALVGGLWPALLAAVGGSLLLNWFFTPPLRTFDVAERENLLALVVFVLIAAAVSAVVDLAARRTREAARASADAQVLATVAGSVLRGTRPLTALLTLMRETFALDSVVLVDRPAAAAAGGFTVPVDDDVQLVLHGRPLAAADQRVVEAFAAQAAVALRQERLAADASRAEVLAEADRLRTALLAAVSHDLRTPLAAAKAAVTSLRSPDVDYTPADRHELLEAADLGLDRLTRLIDNLLDLSRLQAGALGVTPTTVGLEDAIPRALDELGATLTVRLPDDLPAVTADPGLLERVLVNLIGNALRFSPPDRPPAVTGHVHDGRVELRVVDHGPGVPDAEQARVFQPFQRLGDRDNHTGVGLGLALSRGLAEAMGGTLTPETTPGGGFTVVLTLPAAAR